MDQVSEYEEANRLGAEEKAQRELETALAWQALRGTRAGQLVLEDLRGFCLPEKSPLTPDAYHTHVRIGHHEVWLCVLERLAMTKLSFQDFLNEVTSHAKDR